VSDSEITEVRKMIIEENAPAYYTYSKMLSKMQWDLLTAIAKVDKANNIYSNKFLQMHHLGSTSSVRTALKALISRELVYEQDDAYIVYDVFLSRWLELKTRDK
jgi:hypothetical protein